MLPPAIEPPRPPATTIYQEPNYVVIQVLTEREMQKIRSMAFPESMKESMKAKRYRLKKRWKPPSE